MPWRRIHLATQQQFNIWALSQLVSGHLLSNGLFYDVECLFVCLFYMRVVSCNRPMVDCRYFKNLLLPLSYMPLATLCASVWLLFLIFLLYHAAGHCHCSVIVLSIHTGLRLSFSFTFFAILSWWFMHCGGLRPPPLLLLAVITRGWLLLLLPVCSAVFPYWCVLSILTLLEIRCGFVGEPSRTLWPIQNPSRVRFVSSLPLSLRICQGIAIQSQALALWQTGGHIDIVIVLSLPQPFIKLKASGVLLRNYTHNLTTTIPQTFSRTI